MSGLVLEAVESRAATLAALTERTGLSRSTAHRLAVALEVHCLLARDREGRWLLGPRLAELAGGTAGDPLLERAAAVLQRLRDVTGESAQLYRRQGDSGVCRSAQQYPHGVHERPYSCVAPPAGRLFTPVRDQGRQPVGYHSPRRRPGHRP